MLTSSMSITSIISMSISMFIFILKNDVEEVAIGNVRATYVLIGGSVFFKREHQLKLDKEENCFEEVAKDDAKATWVYW